MEGDVSAEPIRQDLLEPLGRIRWKLGILVELSGSRVGVLLDEFPQVTGLEKASERRRDARKLPGPESGLWFSGSPAKTNEAFPSGSSRMGYGPGGNGNCNGECCRRSGGEL